MAQSVYVCENIMTIFLINFAIATERVIEYENRLSYLRDKKECLQRLIAATEKAVTYCELKLTDMSPTNAMYSEHWAQFEMEQKSLTNMRLEYDMYTFEIRRLINVLQVDREFILTTWKVWKDEVSKLQESACPFKVRQVMLNLKDIVGNN